MIIVNDLFPSTAKEYLDQYRLYSAQCLGVDMFNQYSFLTFLTFSAFIKHQECLHFDNVTSSIYKCLNKFVKLEESIYVYNIASEALLCQ